VYLIASSQGDDGLMKKSNCFELNELSRCVFHDLSVAGGRPTIWEMFARGMTAWKLAL